MRNRVSYRNYVGYTNYRGALEVPTFLTLSDVEKVLTRMENDIVNNGYVTVADFYNLTGGTVLEDDIKCGWTDLLSCKIYRSRYGYALEMALPTELNNDPVKEAYDILANANSEDYEDAVCDAMDILRKTL